ncbi:Uncharacterized protein Adt_15684 [Abeliophyllum distichum]|uniref:Uncharacterized protein n=1 Tax=Abeliophyllum distichum TaxID=126358 RepID=A0ABD1U366_9LAMI
MVVICLLLCHMLPCLACAPLYVGSDNFKSAISAAILVFQSWILVGFVSEFFNLNFGEIQNVTMMLSSSSINDSSGRSTVESKFETSGSSVSNTFLSTNDRMMVFAPRTIFAHSSTIRLCVAQISGCISRVGVKSPEILHDSL